MNINSNLNITTLFSSLPKSNNKKDASFHSLSSLLSDYNLIKTGSYKKLMSAYYDKNPDTTFEDPKLSQINVVDRRQLALIQTKGEKVLANTEALLDTSNNKFFEDDQIIDMEALTQEVSDFTANYNTMIKESSTSNSKTVFKEVNNLSIYTDLNKATLRKIGITVESNSLLAFDSETFKAADSTTIQAALHDSGSFMRQVSFKTTMINQYAKLAAYDTPSYTNNGSQTYSNNSGSFFDTLF